MNFSFRCLLLLDNFHNLLTQNEKLNILIILLCQKKFKVDFMPTFFLYTIITVANSLATATATAALRQFFVKYTGIEWLVQMFRQSFAFAYKQIIRTDVSTRERFKIAHTLSQNHICFTNYFPKSFRAVSNIRSLFLQLPPLVLLLTA